MLTRFFSPRGTPKRRPQAFRPSVESLEARLVLSAEFRTFDGTLNNIANPTWGAANTALLRNTTIGYGDDISTPGGADRPSARAISNAVIAQGNVSLPSQQFLSGFVFQWGQFLDHDLDLSTGASPAEPFSVPVPAGDPIFGPLGVTSIGLSRSRYDPTTGTSTNNPRQQLNDLTSYLDGSMVYGSDAARATALRAGVGGRLKTSAGDNLPFNTLGLNNGNPTGRPDDQFFVAGDIRVNETLALTSIQTLFVREHNYQADRIAAQNPGLSDEAIFQQAREIVIAEIQSITYNEFLPAVLGPAALTPYTGYDPTVNASVSNVFATAAFRVGHTMLPSELLRIGPDGNPIAQGNVALRDAFFQPDRIINEGGIEPILRGLTFQIQQEIDAKIVDDVRNFLFDNPVGVFAQDLAALNIQRGRDHGLPGYNQARIDFGLAPLTSFAEITSDVNVQAALASVYSDVNQIDVWVGGIAEDHLPGSSMGPLFTAIWRDQFERARDGDRFFYQRIFSGQKLVDLENTTLADIIRRNTGITNIQDNVFLDRSVMYYQVPVGTGGSDLTLRRNGANLELFNNETNQVVRSQALAGTNAITIVGNNFQADRLTVSFQTGGAFNVPGGIVFAGGLGRGDSYTVVGTNLGDNFAVNGRRVTANGLGADLNNVEAVTLNGRGGSDTYVLATSGTQLTITDSDGTDTLDFSGSAAGVAVNLGRSSVQLIGNGNTLDLNGTIENVLGSAFADILIGNNADNRLSGGGGNDYLNGGNGNDLLLGGGGDDLLLGGSGRNILIGGLGRDLLFGANDEDILIGGTTAHDNNDVALLAIRDEWTSDRPYPTRVANLRDGSGSLNRQNGAFFLRSTDPEPTVFDDGAIDLLMGGNGRDWFLLFPGDLAVDRGPLEQGF